MHCATVTRRSLAHVYHIRQKVFNVLITEANESGQNSEGFGSHLRRLLFDLWDVFCQSFDDLSPDTFL